MPHSLTSVGNEFQTDGAATKKARRASSVRVRRTDSCEVAADLNNLPGVAVWIISLR